MPELDERVCGREIMNALNIALPAEPGGRTRSERSAVGRSLRERVPRSSHAAWSPAADRPDPISLLEEQDRSRLAQFVPIRYGRMIASPFGFLRGSAVVMAGDLPCTSAESVHGHSGWNAATI